MPILNHGGPVIAAGFVTGGGWVFTASEDRTLRIWSAATGNLAGQEMHREDRIRDVWVGGDTAVTLSGSRAVVWDVATVPATRAISLQYEAPEGDLTPGTLAFSRDGRRLLMGDHLGGTWWWLLTMDKPEVEPASLRHTERVNSVAFSPNGKWVVTASSDSTAQVWSADTGLPQRRRSHLSPVLKAVFNPSGELVATESSAGDDRVRLWSPTTGELVRDSIPACCGLLNLEPRG